MERLHGGGFVLNGAGEVSGMTQVMEWGLLETPILLTNTMSVGVVSDAMARLMVEQHPGIGDEHDVIIPVVGECDDSWLNDITGRHVREEHVRSAVASATDGPVAEGSVGGGTGMVTCDFKAGIGTSSRKLPESHGGYTLGVLVMSNFGKMHNLRVGGLPLGEVLEEQLPRGAPADRELREHHRGGRHRRAAACPTRSTASAAASRWASAGWGATPRTARGRSWSASPPRTSSRAAPGRWSPR